jgi:hypothetical protein
VQSAWGMGGHSPATTPETLVNWWFDTAEGILNAQRCPRSFESPHSC